MIGEIEMVWLYFEEWERILLELYGIFNVKGNREDCL